MSEQQLAHERVILAVVASIAGVAYWLVVGTFVLAQFWAICLPGTLGCPTMMVMAARAIGVFGLGIAGFAIGVWFLRRFQILVPYLAAAAIAAGLVLLAALAVDAHN